MNFVHLLPGVGGATRKTQPPLLETDQQRDGKPQVALDGVLERFVIDTSEREPVYLLITPEGRYLRFSRSAFHLLKMVNGGMPMDMIAERFGQNGDRAITGEQVEVAFDRLMERVRALDRPTDVSTFGIRFSKSIMPATFVTRISNALTGAFHGRTALVFLACILWAVVLQWLSFRRSGFVVQVMPHFWPAYALFFVSLLAHEFGHATACARFGGRPADIGVGIYLIFPALYSDVTDAWRLTRIQRVIVDVGGVYFQLIIGAAFVFAFEVTGWRPLQAASVFVAASCLFSLNPFFKFDGYWMIADALGVTNLRSDGRRLLSILKERAFGRTMSGMRWSRGVAVGILGFGAVVVSMWVLFMVHFLPALWIRFSAYPGMASTFVTDMVRSHESVTGKRAGAFILSTYFVIMGLRLVYDMTRQLLTGALGTFGSGSRLGRSRGRPSA